MRQDMQYDYEMEGSCRHETQMKIIKTKLLKEGFVSRNWALSEYISRLSSIIHRLRNEGMHIISEYKKTKHGSDCIYRLKEQR